MWIPPYLVCIKKDQLSWPLGMMSDLVALVYKFPLKKPLISKGLICYDGISPLSIAFFESSIV